MTHIKVCETYGRGVYASMRISRGDLIEVCEVLVLGSKDTRIVNATDLEYYTFVYDAETGKDCLVLGNGEIFNHDSEPNVSYTLEYFGGHAGNRKVMVFRALRDIIPGEQLFIDYNADIPVDTSKYIGENLL